MKGTVLHSGRVKGDNGKIYYPDMIFNDTVLLVYSSWRRVPIKDVAGKRVSFVISPKGTGYNFGLLDKSETTIIKIT